MLGIKDKVVVITGASSGIGEVSALMLAERGAKVVIGARGLDRLEALARRIAEGGGEVAYARTDVRRRIAAAVNAILADVFALYVKTKNFHWQRARIFLRSLSIDWSDKAVALCRLSTASISGIFSQLHATGVAEAL
jgi:NAD(P)-dependent dehydrogenase (short-subunit alcohol dehydrogenase family)